MTLLETAPCGFLSFADDGAIEVVNATLLRMLGYEREEVTGRHVETLLTVGSRIFYQTHLFPLIAMHGHAEEIFLLLQAKNGDDVGVLLNAVRLSRGGHAVNDCVLMHVVERRKFEEALLRAKNDAEAASAELRRANETLEAQAVELEQQAAELEVQATELQTQTEELLRQRAIADEANQAKSNFLAVMSHELRTPLNAIAGYVQLLDLGVHGPVTDPQREALDRIARSQRHLLRLINDILNLARIESGHLEYDILPVKVTEMVTAVMPMLEPQLEAKGIRYAVTIDADIRACADKEKTQQILLNLLTNAMKFTPPGGSIAVTADTATEGVVALHVRDSGIGIPEEMQKRIFEPFVQVDASHTRATEGTGLGLAISRDLARGMAGELSVASVKGKGSTFTLTLPQA